MEIWIEPKPDFSKTSCRSSKMVFNNNNIRVSIGKECDANIIIIELFNVELIGTEQTITDWNLAQNKKDFAFSLLFKNLTQIVFETIIASSYNKGFVAGKQSMKAEFRNLLDIED